MKPVKTTIEDEQDNQRIAVCDGIIHRAAVLMIEETGVTIPVMLDRIFTFATAQAYLSDGKEGVVRALREMAMNVENGALDELPFNNGEVKH